jgi:hypothetical protein
MKKEIQVTIKNNTEKEINNVSCFNSDSIIESELEYSFSMYDENTSSLQFLHDLKEPKEVFIMRYQFNCEDSSNSEKQLDSDFTIKYAEYNLTFRFMKFFHPIQQQMDILDILAEYIDLKLQKDLDIVLERIMPKTSVSISFFSND